MTQSIRDAAVSLVAMVTLLTTPVAFAADATKGKAVFVAKCSGCHSATAAPGGAVAGPNMFGVMGRKATYQAPGGDCRPLV